MCEVPTLDECRARIERYALDAAREALGALGLTFELAADAGAAAANIDAALRHLREHHDFLGCAALLMQNSRVDLDPADREVTRRVSVHLRREADDHFYDRGEYRAALIRYQVAAGLDPTSEAALHEAMGPCLQGSPPHPEVALPYAVVVASMNPRRDEVAYVLLRMRSG